MSLPNVHNTACPAPTRIRKRGFSVIELLLVMGIILILVSVSVPSLGTMMRTYRQGAAMQQIVGDLRKARSEAIRTGWQYRIIGFNSGASSEHRNQYRLMGRQSSAIAWPLDTVDAFTSDTQLAGAWVDINALYPGISFNPDDATADFSVVFDARGVRLSFDSFDPLVVDMGSGTSKSVIVSTVGGIKSE
jgi:prepilin-type N-terminal cleavage/methylation domain-containing protein